MESTFSPGLCVAAWIPKGVKKIPGSLGPPRAEKLSTPFFIGPTQSGDGSRMEGHPQSAFRTSKLLLFELQAQGS